MEEVTKLQPPSANHSTRAVSGMPMVTAAMSYLINGLGEGVGSRCRPAVAWRGDSITLMALACRFACARRRPSGGTCTRSAGCSPTTPEM